MSITAKDEGGNFEQLPPGLYNAVCYAVWDIGQQKIVWNNVDKIQPKAIVAFEVDKRIDNPGTEYHEKRYVVTKEYTVSLSEKANLTKDLISWRGKEFTPEEIQAGFDIEKLQGVPCKLNIIHKTSKNNGRTYANISAIMKMPQDEEGLKPEIDNTPPEWVKKKMEAGTSLSTDDALPIPI